MKGDSFHQRPLGHLGECGWFVDGSLGEKEVGQNRVEASAIDQAALYHNRQIAAGLIERPNQRVAMDRRKSRPSLTPVVRHVEVVYDNS